MAIVNIRAEMNRIIKQWYSATFCLVGLYWKLLSQQSFSGFAYLCHSPSLVHSLDSGRKLSPIRPKQTRFLVTFLNSPFTRREFLAFLWAEFYLWAAFSFSSTSSSTAYGRYTLFSGERLYVKLALHCKLWTNDINNCDKNSIIYTCLGGTNVALNNIIDNECLVSPHPEIQQIICEEI